MNFICIKRIKGLTKDRALLLQLTFILFLLQQTMISDEIGWLTDAFSNLDEAVSLWLLMCFIWKSLLGFRLEKKEQTIVVLSLVIMGIGLLSNILSHLQPMLYAFIDAFTCFKFLFAYLGIRALYSGRINESFIDKNFSWIAKTFAIVFFVFTLHDTFFTPFFPVIDYRFFAYSIKLFYVHPQALACSCIILMCVLLSTMDQHKSNLFFLFMLAFVIFRTFRMKSIGFVAVAFLLLILAYKFHIRSQPLLLLPLLFCGLIIGWQQMQVYFFNTQTARMRLTVDSFKIANQYFPLGSGFATFGSHMAKMHYSPLYQLLGYNGTYGMSVNSNSFLTDTFWPIVIAQFGYIGLISFIVIIVKLFQIIEKFMRTNLSCYLAMLSILLYMMISTTSETAFFNPFATLFFMILGIMVNQSLPQKSDSFENSTIAVKKGRNMSQ